MIRVTIIAFLTMALGPVAGKGEPARCIDDWSVAARIVEQESLTTIEAVRDLVRGEHPGDIVKAVLCETQGNYTYRLTMRAPKGAFKSVTVDAHKREK